MRYEVTTLCDLIKRCPDVIAANFAETGEGHEIDLDMRLYETLDQTSGGFGIVVSDGHGVPVGIATVFMVEHPHNSVLTATNDTIFVMPAYRGSLVPGRLLCACEIEARKRGCTAFQWEVPISSPLDAAFAKRPEYRPIQTLYTKEL